MIGCIFLAAALQIEAPFGKYEIRVPGFGPKEFSLAEYGAKADGTKCTEAFAAAMAACETAGGGRVIVPKGTWLTGAVRLDLLLDANCYGAEATSKRLEGRVVDNSAFPSDWFARTGSCSRECEDCGCCEMSLKTVLKSLI